MTSHDHLRQGITGSQAQEALMAPQQRVHDSKYNKRTINEQMNEQWYKHNRINNILNNLPGN